MKNYNNEYYLIYPSSDSPLIEIDKRFLSNNKSCDLFDSVSELIHDGYSFPITTTDPLLKAAAITDYHDYPRTFSYRVIQDVAQRHEMPGVQWFSAYIMHDNVRYDDFVIMHVHNKISCLDKKKSIYKKRGTFRLSIEKLSLDSTVLDLIELDKRLIFVLEEKKTFLLMHQIIVDDIMKHNPKGIRFVKVKDWGVSEAFG